MAKDYLSNKATILLFHLNLIDSNQMTMTELYVNQ
jgi:hypothetical protein